MKKETVKKETMKKETIEKIEKEIVKQTTMPEDLKNEVRKDIFKNLLLGIAIIVYFIVLIKGNAGGSKDIATVYFNIYSILLLIFSIVLIEVAYRKNNGKTAVYGIELMVVAVLTMFLPYVLFELSRKYQNYYILSTLVISIYYIVKCIVINNRAKKVYVKEESDIEEISKTQKPNENLLDDEEMNIEKLVNRLQPIKRNDKEVEEPKKVVKEKTVAKKAPVKKEEKKEVKEEKPKKGTSTTKKTTVAKKTTTKKAAEEKKENKSVAKKTKTATKAKTTSKKKTTTGKKKTKKEPAKVEPKKEETAPKKRGRPRKVVNN